MFFDNISTVNSASSLIIEINRKYTLYILIHFILITMKKSLIQWHRSTIQRYELTRNLGNRSALRNVYKDVLNQHEIQNKTVCFTHCSHWGHLNKLCLHVHSSKLLTQPELYTTFYQALACVGSGQSPRVIKSKMSISAYKVIKGSLVGTSSTLRSNRMYDLCYKWFFISASLEQSKAGLNSLLFTNNFQNTIVGIGNIFIFEVDRLNYDTFEPMSGLELVYHINKST